MLEAPKFSSYDSYCIAIQTSIKNELEELVESLRGESKKLVRARIFELERSIFALHGRLLEK